MTWPSDLARAQIVTAVTDTVLIGDEPLRVWDRIEPLGRQAWRRFSVLAVGGDLPSLRAAPYVGVGGLVYLERNYTAFVFYERGRHRQSPGRDSDVITDDAERIVASLCRMDYDTPNTGLELLHPTSWRVTLVEDEAVLMLEIDLFARVRREL